MVLGWVKIRFLEIDVQVEIRIGVWFLNVCVFEEYVIELCGLFVKVVCICIGKDMYVVDYFDDIYCVVGIVWKVCVIFWMYVFCLYLVVKLKLGRFCFWMVCWFVFGQGGGDVLCV